jgi:ectoine hydroxylase-related dioxygenase (phytanoyl-CoA dioxygenase family)
MRGMGKKLSELEVARYERDGFLFPVEAFSREQASRYLDQLESFERNQGQEFGKGHNFKPHLLFRWVDEIVHHKAVLDAVEDLIGPDIRLFHLTVWPKHAHDPAFVSWHQDATYFGLEPAVHVTAWVALTDAEIEAGCMEAVPGSHKAGQMHHGETSSEHNLLSRGQTLTEEFDRKDTNFMALQAGQMSLHHTHLIHRSGANMSNHRRVGLGISYIPTSATCRSSQKLAARLVRGTDHYGHFDDEQRPQTDFGEAERAFHAEAVARYRQANVEETLRYDRAAS